MMCGDGVLQFDGFSRLAAHANGDGSGHGGAERKKQMAVVEATISMRTNAKILHFCNLTSYF
jgi:hypothetical protein